MSTRFTATRGLISFALPIGLAVGSLAGCAAVDPATPSPSVQAVNTSASNGPIRITLTLEGPPRNDGLSWADVSIENLTDRGVRWAGGGCGDPGGTFIDLSQALDYGRADWPGRLGSFKERAIGTPRGPGNGALTTGYIPQARIGTNVACTADLRMETLAPGVTLAYRAAWDGTYDGQPVPNGAATVFATFPFIGLEGAVAPDDFDTSPVQAEVLTSIVGAASVGALPPGHAIDIALGDPGLAAWIEASPENTWINPDVGPIGGIWHVGLFVTSGQSERYGGVQIDAGGRIISRHLDP